MIGSNTMSRAPMTDDDEYQLWFIEDEIKQNMLDPWKKGSLGISFVF